MRGFLVAACLVARVWAFTVIPGPFYPEEEGGPSAVYISLPITFDVQSTETVHSDTPAVLDLHLEVFPSEHACGPANVKIDGTRLTSKIEVGFSRGEGWFTTRSNHNIAASWTFRCVQINGEDTKMLLKVRVDQVAGLHVRDAGFAVLFDHTGTTEITRIDMHIFMPRPDWTFAVPDFGEYTLDDPQGLNFREKDVEERIVDLENLYMSIEGLQEMIEAKERIIGEVYPEFFAPQTIGECRSLGCVTRMIFKNVKNSCHKVFRDAEKRIEVEESSVREIPPWWRRPHRKPGNHTCGPPKHGNHSHPHPPHHRPRPPPWRHGRRPHFPHGPIPICRMPPHYAPPHHCPPCDGPPHHGKPHERPSHNGPPPHHDKPEDNLKRPCAPKPKFFITSASPLIPVQPLRVGGKAISVHLDPHDNSASHPHAEFSPTLIIQRLPPHHLHHTHSTSTTHIFLISFIIFVVLAFTHRRHRKSSAYLARLATREERQRQRAARRAAFRRALSRVLGRVFSPGRRVRPSDDEAEFDEKNQQNLVAMEEGTAAETMVGEEIAELRNAVEVMREVVDAEALGEGAIEVLPRYEASVTSSDSGRVADGFMYTPSTTVYTPSESESEGGEP